METPTQVRTVLDEPIWRYPEAEIASGREAVVFSKGPEEQVLWAGLEPGGDARGERLRTSVGDAFDHFRLLASHPPDEGLQHLREHVQRYGITPLCSAHGLPYWHTRPARFKADTDPGVTCPFDSTRIRLDHAVAIAELQDAVLDAAIRIRRRQALPRSVVWQLTEPEFVHSYFRSEFDRAGRLRSPRQRQLVAMVADQLLGQSGARLGVSWVAHRRPELTVRATTSWAVFAVELGRRLGLDDEPPALYRCASCGVAVHRTRRPRPGDQVYCQRPECQRERWRRNKARQRHETGGSR